MTGEHRHLIMTVLQSISTRFLIKAEKDVVRLQIISYKFEGLKQFQRFDLVSKLLIFKAREAVAANRIFLSCITDTEQIEAYRPDLGTDFLFPQREIELPKKVETKKPNYKAILRNASNRASYGNDFVKSCALFYINHGHLSDRQIESLRKVGR